MDFAWTRDQEELQTRTLAFARSLSVTTSNGFDRARFVACGGFGMLGLSLPVAHGGMGLSALDTAGMVEAFSRGCTDMGLAFASCAHLFACAMPIAEHGSDALKQALLPGLASGALVGANAISESEAGSDVFALQMTARRAGDDWLLNGVKSYVTNGPVADVMLVYASTNPAHRWLGISAFAVDSKSAGLRAGQPFAKVGLHSAESGAVYFDDVRVPAHRLLGAEGQGAAIFQASMAWERACLFAAYLGSMARDLDKAVAFAQERKQFGKAIGKYQAIAHKIADMKLRLECARMMLWRACWKKDRGLDASVDISLAKLAVSEAAVQSGLDVIHIHGSLGVSAESRVAESLMDALPATIFSGTSEMQREIVARGLGL